MGGGVVEQVEYEAGETVAMPSIDMLYRYLPTSILIRISGD